MCVSQTEHLNRGTEQMFCGSEDLLHDFESGMDGIGDIKQEVVDSLIATRAVYEPTSEGANDVLNRRYELYTSKYELLYHQDQVNRLGWTSEGLDQHVQPFVMVRSSNGYIIVACRGTFALSDIVQDAKVAKVPVPFTRKGRAQLGFLERAMSLPFGLLLDLLRGGQKLLFAGHSMGGAVTSLVAIRVLEALAAVPGHGKLARDRVKCITFGTAPFADLELADYVNSTYRGFFYNLVSKHDIVPRVHNLIPRVLFPAAKWFVEMMSKTWEVQTSKAIIENTTGMPVVKVVKKLEERMQSLWPATRLFKFILQCAAGDEEALFYKHCGYLVLLDPESLDPNSVIHIDEMESLGNDFFIEGKSVVQVFLEHGLANHYACLVHNLSAMKGGELAKRPTACRGAVFFSRELSSGFHMSIKQLFSNPSRVLMVRFNNALLRLTGNNL